jgi:hypothetical protein
MKLITQTIIVVAIVEIHNPGHPKNNTIKTFYRAIK